MKARAECFAFCFKKHKKKPQNCGFFDFYFKFSHNRVVYFNYHAKVKHLIEQGHATTWEIVEEYHNIRPCLLIYFDDDKIFPIRQHKFEEYIFLMTKLGVENCSKKGIDNFQKVC